MLKAVLTWGFVSLCVSQLSSPPCPPQSPTVPLYRVTVWHLDAPPFHGPCVSNLRGKSRCLFPYGWNVVFVKHMALQIWPREEGFPREGWAGKVVMWWEEEILHSF